MSAPRDYIDARWAGTTGHPQTGAPVLLLTTPQGKMRFLLSPDCGEAIVRTGEQYWLQPRSRMISQEPSSSGSPQVDGSTPVDGQNVCPPTRSSSAISGDGYAPSDSSLKNACQRPDAKRISNLPQRLSTLQKVVGGHFFTRIRPHRLLDPSHDGESRGARKRSAALSQWRDALSDVERALHVDTPDVLWLIGAALFALGLFFYLAMVAADEAARLIFGSG